MKNYAEFYKCALQVNLIVTYPMSMTSQPKISLIKDLLAVKAIMHGL